MLKFVQKFVEKISNLLLGDYISRQENSYETLLKAIERKVPEPPPPDEVHHMTYLQMKKAKKDFFSRALEGGIASLYLNPRAEGVSVPSHLRNMPSLVLNYSYRYHIADFDFDDERVVASLSFQGTPYQCIVPWDAVVGIGNHSEEAFYSFGTYLSSVDDKTGLNAMESENPEFDQVSHERAVENRKKFKVIKGEKE